MAAAPRNICLSASKQSEEMETVCAYYLAGRAQPPFYDDFYGGLVLRLGVRRALEADLPRGVTAGLRTDGEYDYVFVQNFTGGPVKLTLDAREYVDMESGEAYAPGGELELPAYGVRVLRRRAEND